MSASSGLILIVEEDEAVRDSLRFTLEVEGLEVRTYADPDALLGEEHLPKRGCLVVGGILQTLHGHDLLRRLRDRDVHLPLVLITADASKAARHRAAKRGAWLVPSHPVDGDALVASILEALAASA